jgi:putative FmdB family regulatory protein
MPIYAYRCSNCGHAQDVLRKISDPPLTVCPACGEPTYVKQVTAAGFQLKGSGWYVTDFRGDNKPGKPADSGASEGGEKKADGGAGDSAKAGESGKKADTAPAAAPAPAAATPAAAPAPAAPGKTGS